MSILSQYICPLFLIASFFSTVTGYQYFRYRTPVAKVGAAFLLLLALELSSYSMLWIAGPFAGIYFWYFLQLVSFYLMLALWFFFILQLVTSVKIIHQIVIFGITCIPAFILAILLVTKYFSREFSISGSIEIGSVFGLFPLIGNFGIFMIYFFYVIGFFALLVILRFILTGKPEPKLITLPMLFGTLSIVLIGAMEHAGINPFMPVYTVQLGLAVISLLFFYIAIGLKFGGILPLGRDGVFEVIHDGIILLDPQNRIVDLNPSAEQYIRQNRKTIIKKNISDLWPQIDRLLRESPLGNVVRGEFDRIIDGIEFIYECTITRFVGLNNATMGRLVALRNITDRERMENTLKLQSQSIARTNIILKN